MERDYEAEVRLWFACAKRGGCGINLYFKPLRDVFCKLTTPVMYKGLDLGLVEFEGGVYEQYAGSGDCEEKLRYIGKTNE